MQCGAARHWSKSKKRKYACLADAPLPFEHRGAPWSNRVLITGFLRQIKSLPARRTASRLYNASF